MKKSKNNIKMKFFSK